MTYRIGWGRDLPRLSRSTQKRALLDAGCATVWIEGCKRASGELIDWSWFLRAVRAGDLVMVHDGRVIMYPPKGKATPRRRLFAGLQDIEKKGATVETLDGKHTRTTVARDAFIEATLDRDSDATGKTGRPPVRPTEDELKWMMPIWTSLRVPTNKAACDMIRAEAVKRGGRWQRVSVQMLIHKLGGSGRSRIRKPARKGK